MATSQERKDGGLDWNASQEVVRSGWTLGTLMRQTRFPYGLGVGVKEKNLGSL